MTRCQQGGHYGWLFDNAGLRHSVFMPSDHELWTLALMVERERRAAGPQHIAEQIGAAAIAGDWDDVRMWKAVAAKYDQLLHQGTGVVS